MKQAQCPHCGGYGITRVKRSVFARLFRLENKRACIDCGAKFSQARAIPEDESSPAPRNASDTSDEEEASAVTRPGLTS